MSDGGDFWGKGPVGSGGPENMAGEEGFWSKKGKPAPPPPPPPPEPAKPEPTPDPFWTKAKTKKKAAAEESAALKADPDLKKKRRRRPIRRISLWTGGTVLVVLVLALIFAPQIGGWLAPGIIEGQASGAISGKASVGDVSLSWGGPQTLTDVRLAGTDGKQIAKLSASCTASLLSLIRGKLDLGEITVTGGKVDVVKEADGTTNLERAPAPPGNKAAKKEEKKPAGPVKELRLPQGLLAKVVVKRLQATYLDKGAADGPVSVTLKDTDLSATVAPGQALVLEAATLATLEAAG